MTGYLGLADLVAMGNGVVPQQAALAVGWLLEQEMVA